VTLGGWKFAADVIVGRRIRQVRVSLAADLLSDEIATDEGRSVDA
jgi:hypothetical protein